MLWDKAGLDFSLHAAAKIGFIKALERILKMYPGVKISRDGSSMAIYHAAGGYHLEVVKLLLKNNPQALPPKPWDYIVVRAVLHCGNRAEIFDSVELLLEADDSHKCMEYKDGWGITPLLLAAYSGKVRCFEVLLRHGASVSAVAHCIKNFSPEEYEVSLKRAQENEPDEVARLFKSYIP